MTTAMSETAERGQLTGSAAGIYEQFFVPALFRDWAAPLCAAADVKAGDNLLDVACGTGVVAREGLSHVGPDGSVTGLDRNAGMLVVAGSLAPEIDWREGLAEDIPFEDGSFDALTCQFGLMFFEDREKAVSEMWRVLRPGGRMAVAVWDTLPHTPGYDAMAGLLAELFGRGIAAALEAPYNLGDPAALLGIFEAAGIADAVIRTRPGLARFPSIEDWVYTDIKGWTLSEAIDEAQFQALLAAAKGTLARFTDDAGRVEFCAPAHIVTAVKGE